MNEKNKEIYVLNLDFSKMRFLANNEAVNTTLFSNYSLISLNKKEFKEIFPEIKVLFRKIIDKYIEKFQFINTN